MDRLICWRKTVVSREFVDAQSTRHSPHLCEPTSWRLCEGNPCSASIPAQRRLRRTRQLQLVTVTLAITYALAIAIWFPAETPLLLLAVLPLPGAVDALTENAH